MNLISEIKNSWSWVGIDPEEIVGENDFGNLMIRDCEGKYWRLCPEDVYCKVVAENRAELDALSRNQEFLADWYMEALVTQARQALGPLPEDRKYHLVIPGALGGEYAISNIKTAPLVELVRFSGDIGRQIKDLPDGSQIELKVVD
ncbi:DUF1851 domain-containing protein [Methylomonas methanica]|uniref:T6SS immunity protein Tdi1 C-terminal domain-containing protein n=1 Tax=Methylomonas methanica (strain DSM 25384 / MC09) TaxID=857087 RepID=F9ZZA0_METMM|nr:DUF1851 domain-containing protein [Methylomonas methanica]AEG01126.1 hypothetical protein Metme_2743 [Methylomonas methanica MC09]